MLTKDPNKPYYSCDINQTPTVIFPIIVEDGKPIGLGEIEKHLPVLKASNQVNRLEIHLSKEGIYTRVIFLNDYKRLKNI